MLKQGRAARKFQLLLKEGKKTEEAVKGADTGGVKVA